MSGVTSKFLPRERSFRHGRKAFGACFIHDKGSQWVQVAKENEGEPNEKLLKAVKAAAKVFNEEYFEK